MTGGDATKEYPAATGTVLSRQRRAVVVGGEIDMVSVPEVTRELLAVLADGETHVVVDLAAVEFIDATGISALIAAANAARDAGGTLALRLPSEPVRRLLDICNLHTALPTEVPQ